MTLIEQLASLSTLWPLLCETQAALAECAAHGHGSLFHEGYDAEGWRISTCNRCGETLLTYPVPTA